VFLLFSMDNYANASSRGDLSVRSLVDVVSAQDFIPESEYMESVLVAVPR